MRSGLNVILLRLSDSINWLKSPGAKSANIFIKFVYSLNDGKYNTLQQAGESA